MKKIICIYLAVLLSAISLKATSTVSDSIVNSKLSLAYKLILSNGHERAYALFNECASAGSAIAVNAIGVMKQKGWGTPQDEAGSVQWFQKAADMGYAKAYYNLAQIYTKGLGVEQDFVKSNLYIQKLVDQNDPWGNFQLGYNYYKGLGVEQNYIKAIAYFKVAADKNNANAFYFLGLCYRNGYGVERDAGEAQYYLNKAAEKGHYYSQQELAEAIPENPVKAMHVKAQSSEAGDETTGFRKIVKQKIQGKLDGHYTGKVLVYDYSGKNVVRESNLEIRIDNMDDKKIYGRWIEADTIVANFEGLVTDSTLQFVQTSYARTDYYNKNQALVWKFKQALLEKTDLDGKSLLTGNVQLYSPLTKEPEKPMYITLQKVNLEEKAEITPDISSRFLVYPNPFVTEMNVSFDLAVQEEVKVDIYSVNGVLKVTKNLGVLEVGRHDYVIDLDLPPAQYIILLQKKSGKLSTVINKN